MSNKTEKKEAPLNVVQRTDRLEKAHNTFVSEVVGSFGRIDSKFAEHSELFASIIEILGQDAVLAKLNERQANRDREQAEKSSALVKAAVEKGDLKPVDVIGEKTLIVGKDLDKEGKTIGPGRVQVAFGDLKPDFKAKLLGGKVGTSVVTTEDEKEGVTQTFEVMELYENVVKAAPAPEAEQTAPAEATPATQGQ
jgi:hypothetical protein